MQILYLNLITDVFPAFALGLGQGDGREMLHPPRDPAEPLIGRGQWARIAALGGVQTVSTLGAFLLALVWLRIPVDQAVTVAFLSLALAQLWNVFNTRAADTGVLANDVARNPFVWAALGLCAVLIAMALWLPGLAAVLQLTPPGAAGLVLAAVASLIPLLLGQAALVVAGRPFFAATETILPSRD